VSRAAEEGEHSVGGGGRREGRREETSLLQKRGRQTGCFASPKSSFLEKQVELPGKALLEKQQLPQTGP